MHRNRLILIISAFVILFNLAFIDNVQAANNVETFVAGLYQNVQDRVPDPEGEKYWVDMLENKKSTAADVVKNFLLSPEFLNKNTSNDQYVVTLYKALQNRLPDSTGQSYWVNLLDKGYSRLRVLSGFISSQEFISNCTSYGITPGSIVEIEPIDTNPQIVSFVTRLYDNILNRNPDQDGLKYYATNLVNNKSSAAETIIQFVKSNEFTTRNLSNTEYLTTMYKTLQNREPDNEGLSYWLERLNVGYSRQYVLAFFINSEEFSRQCQIFGIIQGTANLKNFVTIVLDAGHGGNDPGAVSGNYQEKVLNMQIVQKLGNMLQELGYNVLYTRNPLKDQFIELDDRTEFANLKKADLFLSIHHNSSTSTSVSGFSTHYSSYRPEVETNDAYVVYKNKKYPFIKEVTSKINGVLASTVYFDDNGITRTVDINDCTVYDSTPTEAAIKSEILADKLVQAVTSLGLSSDGADPSKDHNLFVTRHTTMPSVLLEIGYLSNPFEISKISESTFQNLIVQKIVESISQLF